MTKIKTRVQREVEYMRTLRHPHIIKLYVFFGAVELFSMSCFAEDFLLRMTTLRPYLRKSVVCPLFCFVPGRSFLSCVDRSCPMPSYLSVAMLAVDPVKQITTPEITQHPFYTTDLQRHLTFLPPRSLDDLEIHPLCGCHQRRDCSKNGLG